MVSDWLYNKNRRSGSGSGVGGRGKFKLTSEPTKTVAAVQYYWSAKAEEVTPQLLALWKKEQSTVDNTEYLGVDEGLTAPVQLTKEEQDKVDQDIIKKLPLGWKTKAMQEIYEKLPQDVKDQVERERKADENPVEEQDDLRLRQKMLRKIDG